MDTKELPTIDRYESSNLFIDRYALQKGVPIYRSNETVILYALDCKSVDDYESYFRQELSNVSKKDNIKGNAKLLNRQQVVNVLEHLGEKLSTSELNDELDNERISETKFINLCIRRFGRYRKVIIKFMTDIDCWKREIEYRASLNSEFIVSIIASYGGTIEFTKAINSFMKIDDRLSDNFSINNKRKMSIKSHEYDETKVEKVENRPVRIFNEPSDLSETKSRYQYALVMPAGENNLENIFRYERPNIVDIQWYCYDICTALKYIHSQGLVHGNLTMQNVIRFDDSGVVKLTDFKSSCRFDNHVLSNMNHNAHDESIISNNQQTFEYMGRYYSSAVLPPEMFAILENDNDLLKFYNYYKNEREQGYGSKLWHKVKPILTHKGHIVVKTFLTNEDGDPLNVKELPYTLLPADPSIDVWSFGVLLYNLIADRPLFTTNRDDDLKSKASLVQIATWSVEYIRQLIDQTIEHNMANSLLKQLLHPNPEERISIIQVLNHPFFADLHDNSGNI